MATTSENFHEAIELAFLFPNCLNRDSALSGIARFFVRYEMLDRALTTVKMISSIEIKMVFYRVISQCYIEARNDIKKRVEILNLIPDRFIRQLALKGICENLSTCNRKKEAVSLRALMLQNEHRKLLIGVFILALLGICVSYFSKFLENKE